MDLTEEIIEKLCACVKLGASVDTAALAEGVNMGILKEWMNGDILPARIIQARAQAEILHLQRIISSGTAKESQWVLERMYPEKWAAKRPETPQKKKYTASIIDAAFQSTPKTKRLK